MRRLWQRLARLARQSEIRLPAARLRLSAVRPGDRLQIGPRLWRVKRTSPSGARVELAAVDGRSRARLRVSPGEPESAWILEDAEAAIRVAPEALLHFGLDEIAETAGHPRPSV